MLAVLLTKPKGYCLSVLPCSLEGVLPCCFNVSVQNSYAFWSEVMWMSYDYPWPDLISSNKECVPVEHLYLHWLLWSYSPATSFPLKHTWGKKKVMKKLLEFGLNWARSSVAQEIIYCWDGFCYWQYFHTNPSHFVKN